ncbi:MAG: fimbrial assembly protein [Wenzhouxiangella sp.]|nr:fimbrial assembly protein [Wenzhouxiangella sp.]
MKALKRICTGGIAAVAFIAGQSQANIDIAQGPLFGAEAFPPMNMLVMGRDHSLFYQAYNDASDLTGNGVPDVGYKPAEIDYYGYFDSFKCYNYESGSGGRFVPIGSTGPLKTCGSGWSGDFLNWVTTSRIDALRKVLYGGSRFVDDADRTVLARSYIPQDAHSWGKEYQSIERDGFDIRDYTPLSLPGPGRYHLFANTSLGSDPNRPRMRVLRNTGFRVWEWVAIERPVAGNRCLDGGSGPLCTSDADGMDDYTVRIEVCVNNPPSVLPEENCRRYPTGTYKPIGLLQEFGEDGRMHFGLISGSYLRNMSGGVLRKPVGNISDEINPATGQWSDVSGIIRTIDSFRIVGLRSSLDYHPGWQGAWLTTRQMNEGEFPDWGNPIAEMVYESVRYFAGVAAPTAAFVPPLTSGMERVTNRMAGASDIDLPVAEWDNPWQGRPYCTKAAQLIISNTNISFDGEFVPGSYFSNFSGDLPSGLNLNAQAIANQIWSLEGGGTRPHFIGQVGNDSDGAPTVKQVSGLGNIRGLSPEEPTREGTFYTASVARFGAFNDLRPGEARAKQNVETFSVALASQLPRIEFPVDGNLVTLVPFGKSVQGCAGISPDRNRFQPMAQIVDFFVETWANTHPENHDPAINDGRPFASFRINFEDVEQAADHDMDGIVNYQVRVTESGQLEVTLTPEYYAGCIKMNVGYVISGVESEFLHPTNAGEIFSGPADGLYLDVRGDPSANDNMVYFLNTPPGIPPGACALQPIPPQYQAACSTAPGLPPGAFNQAVTRVFTPSGGPAATVLRDPLWWAAKYGNTANEGMAAGETPENYYLVTNAATLAEQLQQAFTQILDLATVAGAVTDSTRLTEGSLIFQASFDTSDASGNVRALNAEDQSVEWNLSDRISEGQLSWSSRNIITYDPASRQTIPFRAGDIPADLLQLLGLGSLPSSIDQGSLIDYIRGNHAQEEPNGPLRARSSRVGTIVNSQLTVANARNETWSRLPVGGGSYLDYLQTKRNRGNVLLFGSNNGMVHGVNAETGHELFAYVPTAVFENLHMFADPSLQHRYFVDGQLAFGDVYDGGWKTVVVGGFGAGAKGVFALDITQPGSPRVIWELTPQTLLEAGLTDEAERLGHVYGTPQITRLENGQWVAVFGNGLNAVSNHPALFVVSLTDSALNSNTVRTAEPRIQPNQRPANNGLASPALFLTPGTRDAVRRAYAGDLSGRLWRFDFQSSVPIAPQDPLFRTNDNRPILSAPEVAASPTGGVHLFFGTGKLVETSDVIIDGSTPIERLYAIRDINESVAMNQLGQRRLAETTIDGRVFRTIELVSERAKGWYLDLSVGGGRLGERVLFRPSLIFGRLFFTTYQPVDDPCQGGGINRQYLIDALSGAAALDSACPTCAGVALEDTTGPISPSPVIREPSSLQPGDDPILPPIPDLGTDDDPLPPLEGTGRVDWCSEIGYVDPLTGVFQRIGRICEGRQSWRQAR